ncbi:unnamed protein product, partial [Darwinula stevensoni]
INGDKKPESVLEPALLSLIELICDLKVMEEGVLQLQYDTNKTPLGKLTREQICAGYKELSRIDELLANGKLGKELVRACSDYYTRIPHYFGMSVPPVIRTPGMVRKELELLEALGDIQLALDMFSSIPNASLHPADQRYKSLCCTMKHVDPSQQDYKIVEKYLQSTHAVTHNQYEMILEDLFEYEKDEQTAKFHDSFSGMDRVSQIGLGSLVKAFELRLPKPPAQDSWACGAQVPMGPGIPSALENLALNYNEYVVYDPWQLKMKYILRVRFNFK